MGRDIGMTRAKRITLLFGIGALVLTPTIAFAECKNVGPATVGACQSPPPSTASTQQQNPSADGAAARSLHLINGERAKRGLGALSRNAQLEAIALGHAREMANAGKIYHNADLFTQATIDSLGSPDEVGENVGRGSDADSLHASFMDSTSHRANILGGAYVTSGIAVVSAKGELWVVQTFMSRPHRWTGGLFVNTRARNTFQDVPPAVARVPEIGAAVRWQRPGGSAADAIVVHGTDTQVLGLRKTFSQGGGIGGIVLALAFSVVVGAALPRTRDEAEYV